MDEATCLSSCNTDFGDDKEYNFVLSSRQYPKSYIYVEGNTIKAGGGEHSMAGAFYLLEKYDGYCLLECTKFPNHFICETTESVASLTEFDELDEALFMISSLGDGTVSISSKRWPKHYMCMPSAATVGFSKTLNEAAMWIFEAKKGSSTQPIEPSRQVSRPIEHPLHGGELLTLSSAEYDEIPSDYAIEKGRKTRKNHESSWTDEQSNEIRLGTCRHNEWDVITLKVPAKERSITDIGNFNKECCSDAMDLIAETVVFGSCQACREAGTMNQNGKVRLDNQGDFKGEEGRRYANLQLQIGHRTVAAALIEIGPQFGQRHIRRALIESLTKQKVVHLWRDRQYMSY